MVMQWDPSLSLGVEHLDAQHQEFFRRLQRFLDACKGNQGGAALAEMLGYLRRYAEEHFAAEELLMREQGFPYLATHQEQHAEFIAKLDRLTAAFEQRGTRADTIAEAMDFASTWLIRHIKSSDLVIARWLRREP